MAVKARDDVTLAALSDVSNVRRYYLMQSSTLNPPPAPTTNPAPSPWSTVEPTYTEGSTTTLYTVDLTVFSDGTFDYSPVSKSAAFEASKKAYNKALSAVGTANAALAAVPPFIQAGTPSAAVVGQLWFPLDANGRVIGMKRANATGTSGWVDYLAMAGKILVPGSVGTTEIGPDGVTAANIQASNALWAKLASFAKVTTDMLVAGNATITEELLANVITGIILRGGLFEAGGGSLPMVRIGPLSGQVGVGDTYGVQITTPNSNANGRAVLAVAPTGPYLEFYDGTGTLVLVADKTGMRVPNRAGGGMVDLSTITTQRWGWIQPTNPGMKVGFDSQGGWSPWAFFEAANNEVKVGSVFSFSTPTGKIRLDSGCAIATEADGPYLSVQWGIYTSDPSNNGRLNVAKDLYGSFGRAESRYASGTPGYQSIGAEIVDVEPNRKYWVRPYYRQLMMANPATYYVRAIWVSASPIT